MNAHAHLAPMSWRREFLDRWINDTHLGDCVAHWVGKRIGEKSLQVLIDPAEAIPWTPVRQPMAQATVALAGTGGFYLCTDTPFSDWTTMSDACAQALHVAIEQTLKSV
jgi:hypothetical protein